MNAHTSKTASKRTPIVYRDWLISTNTIDGKLWLRWQHPQESFPRFNYEVGDKGLSEAIRYVRFLIDLAIKLENSNPEKQADDKKIS